MPVEPGIGVTGKAVPKNTADTYATHEDRLQQGGWRICVNEAEMLAIPYDRRKDKLGMEAKFPDGSGGWKRYELTSINTSDATVLTDWTEVTFGVPGPTSLIGSFTPSGSTIGTQYPDTTGVSNGVWAIDGLSGSFTYTTGPLSGEDVSNGNGIIYDGATWVIIEDYQLANLEPYLMKDGSKQMDSSFTPINDRDLVYKKWVLDNVGGGHEVQEDGVASTQEDALNFITNGERDVVSNDSGVATKVDLQFEANTDVDPTGKADADIWQYNALTAKTEPGATKVFDEILHSVDANITADGQLSSICPAGYKITSVTTTEYSSAAAGNVSIGDIALGGQVVSGQPVLADDDIKLELDDSNGIYFSRVNDTDLYISSDDWTASPSLTIYITYHKI